MLENFDLSLDKKVMLDPDNLFWAITSNGNQAEQKLKLLYARQKQALDKELYNFRFSANLSAIYIDPTDRCNANCPYCYIPAKIRKNGAEMTKKQLFYILDKIIRDKISKRKFVIVFHASEPLLAKEIIFAAIEEYKDKFYFGLQTNALLLEEKDVEFLKRHRVGVGISLDSHLPGPNNRLRPTGNFKQVMRALTWFDGYSGLNVITTVTKLNVRHLAQIVRFLHKKGVPCVLLNPLRLTQKYSRALKPDEKLLTKYFLRAVDTAIELSKNSGKRIIIGNFTNVILGIVAPTARRLMCDISPCGGGRCFLTITASGRMIPCGEFIGFKGKSGGNIFNTSIRKAMQSALFKKLRARTVEKIDECKICIFRNICGAPCPAELMALGKANQKSVFCNFYKEIINYAFKLIARGEEIYCFRGDALDNLKYRYRLGGRA